MPGMSGTKEKKMARLAVETNMALRQIYGTRKKSEDSNEKSGIVVTVITVIVVEATAVELTLKPRENT